MPKPRAFLDTNVILEAFRTRCWGAISNRFNLETVDKCVEEALTGNPHDSRYVQVPPRDLIGGLSARHAVERRAIASLALQYPQSAALDDGEKHLFAWLLANSVLKPSLTVVSTADKAALVVACSIGWGDCAVALDQLAASAGASRTMLAALATQYRDPWLQTIKMQIRMGAIP